MREFIGEEFEGVISGVASFGFWVETIEHKCEGLVSINSLSIMMISGMWKAIMPGRHAKREKIQDGR